MIDYEWLFIWLYFTCSLTSYYATLVFVHLIFSLLIFGWYLTADILLLCCLLRLFLLYLLLLYFLDYTTIQVISSSPQLWCDWLMALFFFSCFVGRVAFPVNSGAGECWLKDNDVKYIYKYNSQAYTNFITDIDIKEIWQQNSKDINKVTCLCCVRGIYCKLL